MELPKLVDLVLNELVSTRQPSISVRRILKSKKIEYTDDVITSIEGLLESKSLVIKKDVDSEGYACYSLTVTGQDFIKTFGSYSKFLRGIESENRKVQRAKSKKPYKAMDTDGNPPAPFTPMEPSFMDKHKLELLFLVVVLVLFFVVAKITD
ncbi:MAG: hypothetical protein K9J17_02370 [Flavobacteriales bacterium]|nr:hypothetical protein [Flavobacteriales bacterium]